MRGNDRASLILLLLLWCGVLTLLPFVEGGIFLIQLSVAFWLLLLILPVITWTPFRISSRLALSTLVILALVFFIASSVLKWMPNFEDPVSEQQARVMASHWLRINGIKGSPGYVFMRKGDDAGDIGYYVFDLNTENKGFLIVPADARFTSIHYRDDGVSYLDFFIRNSYMLSRLPHFNNTPLLKLKSFTNTILSQKSKEQLAWRDVFGGNEEPSN